jgi:hypothetical protein
MEKIEHGYRDRRERRLKRLTAIPKPGRRGKSFFTGSFARIAVFPTF